MSRGFGNNNRGYGKIYAQKWAGILKSGKSSQKKLQASKWKRSYGKIKLPQENKNDLYINDVTKCDLFKMNQMQ